MAMIKFNDESDMPCSAEQGHRYWAVMNGEVEPDEDEMKFCSKIKHIYLNRFNAPDSYIERYREIIFPIALSEWSVDRNGKLMRPGDESSWEFARRWGLWYMGQPSSIVNEFIRTGKIKITQQQEMV